MRWFIVLLFILPLAAAGSADDPEVDDGAGDDSVSSRPGLGAAGANLVKGWYEEDGDNLLFLFQSGGMCADPTETIEYRWYATVDGAEVAFGADLQGGAGSFCPSTPTTISPTGAATAASFSGAVATLTIPKTAFGDGSDGTILAGTYGTSKAYVTSPEAWNDSDRAPDEGGGRDYVLGGPMDGPRIERHNVTDGVDQVTNATQPLSATYLFNYTGPENVTLTIHVAGNGTINVTVLDPTGGEQYRCACTDGTNETQEFTSSAGVWQVNITYDAFQGTASISLAPSLSTVPPEDLEPSGNATIPEEAPTDEGPQGEDSPMPLLVVVAALFVARRFRS